MASFPGHSHEFYRRVIIAVPLVTPLVLIPIVLTLTCLCGCKHKSTPWRLLLADPFLTSQEKQHFNIRERTLPHYWVLALLLVKALLVAMFGLAEYLSEALIGNEIGCSTGPSWDCFMIESRDLSGEGVTRITNCSDFSQFQSTDRVECYQVAFDVLTVSGQLGGIAFVTHIATSAYVALYFTAQFIQNRCLRILGANFVIFVFFLLFVVTPVAFNSKYATFDFVETLNVMMHDVIIAVYYPFIYVVITLAMVIRSKCTFDDFYTDYDPNTTVITVGGPIKEVGGAIVSPLTHTSVQVAQGNKVQFLNAL